MTGERRKIAPKVTSKFQSIEMIAVIKEKKKKTPTPDWVIPSLSNSIFALLCFHMTVGGGELITSHMMTASSPSVNSCGDVAFLKVIFSAGRQTHTIIAH